MSHYRITADDGIPYRVCSTFYDGCCDCGSVHKVKLKKISPRVYELTATRAERRTAYTRKNHLYDYISIAAFNAVVEQEVERRMQQARVRKRKR